VVSARSSDRTARMTSGRQRRRHQLLHGEANQQQGRRESVGQPHSHPWHYRLRPGSWRVERRSPVQRREPTHNKLTVRRLAPPPARGRARGRVPNLVYGKLKNVTPRAADNAPSATAWYRTPSPNILGGRQVDPTISNRCRSTTELECRSARHIRCMLGGRISPIEGVVAGPSPLPFRSRHPSAVRRRICL